MEPTRDTQSSQKISYVEPWGRSCRACNEEVSSIKKLAKISPLIPSASKQKRREIVQRMPHLPTEEQTTSSNIYQDFGL